MGDLFGKTFPSIRFLHPADWIPALEGRGLAVELFCPMLRLIPAMKIHQIFLGAFAGFAAISAAVAVATPVKPDARAEVIFVQPEKFTDVRDSYGNSEKGREANLSQIRDYILSRAGHYIPAGDKLTVSFTDIDLAGDFEPWRGPQGTDIRIVKDIYPPRIDLEFKLTAADGTVVKEGKRQLRDLVFMSRLSVDRTDALRFEKGMLDDWMSSEFASAK